MHEPPRSFSRLQSPQNPSPSGGGRSMPKVARHQPVRNTRLKGSSPVSSGRIERPVAKVVTHGAPSFSNSFEKPRIRFSVPVHHRPSVTVNFRVAGPLLHALGCVPARTRQSRQEHGAEAFLP